MSAIPLRQPDPWEGYDDAILARYLNGEHDADRLAASRRAAAMARAIPAEPIDTEAARQRADDAVRGLVGALTAQELGRGL